MGGVKRKASQQRHRKKAKPPGRKRKATAEAVDFSEVEEVVVPDEQPEPEEEDMNAEDNVPGCSNISQTASERKVESIPEPEITDVPTGYRFMDMNLLFTAFTVVACPGCYQKTLTMSQGEKQGLAYGIILSCTNIDCEWNYSFATSKKQQRHYDINRRIYYATRSTGNGYSGMKKFLRLMNHPPPMTEKNYRKLNVVFRNASKEVAEDVMKEAALQLHEKKTSTDEVLNTGVSVDGTWQKRGFTSMNGAVAAISMETGRILDVEVMTRFCQGCVNILKYKDDPEQFKLLQSEHICKINHEGSAGKMELVGAERIFKRSIETRKLRYLEYYGDGDSKSFATVENVYAPLIVTKKECIGHVQKRVGSRLRSLKKKEKGLTKLGITDKMIDRLQNYYGIAIRSNVGDLEKMKKAVFAALFHVCSSAENNYHVHCPPGDKSWCTYQLDLANGTNFHKPGKGLPQEAIIHLKPIFTELANENLLGKCLHGKTQNQNECFNGFIWKRTPKDRFVKRDTMEFAVYDSVAHFNVGSLASLLIYDKVAINRGYYTTLGCIDNNEARVSNSVRLMSEKVKTRRRYLRGKKKGFGDKLKKNEDKPYDPGNC